MSKFLLLALFLIVSCVPEEQETAPDSVGNVRRFAPVAVEGSDLKRIHAVCLALAAKEDILNILINTAEQYTFQYAQKNCDDRNMPEMKDVVTTIQGFDPYYTFQTMNNAFFGFPNVETTSNGILAEVCEDVLADKKIDSPMTTRTGAIWFSSNSATQHCRHESDAYCVHIQRGTAINSYDYRIHTNEWMKVQVSGNRRGFFTERKLVSSANCRDKKEFEKRAVLR